MKSKNKAVKELRKDKGYTAKELASVLKVDEILIKKTDNKKLKEIPEPLKSRLIEELEP